MSHNTKILRPHTGDYREMISALRKSPVSILCLQDVGEAESTSKKLKYLAANIMGKGTASVWSMGARGADSMWYGGTAILVTPTLADKVSSTASDPAGLGRFCSLTLRGKNGRALSTISTYVAAEGSMMQARQQTTLGCRDTRSKHFADLSTHIIQLRAKGHAILLCGDMNMTWPGDHDGHASDTMAAASEVAQLATAGMLLDNPLTHPPSEGPKTVLPTLLLTT